MICYDVIWCHCDAILLPVQTRAESEAAALTNRRQQLEQDGRAVREKESKYKGVIKTISEEINAAHMVKYSTKTEQTTQWPHKPGERRTDAHDEEANHVWAQTGKICACLHAHVLSVSRLVHVFSSKRNVVRNGVPYNNRINNRSKI